MPNLPAKILKPMLGVDNLTRWDSLNVLLVEGSAAFFAAQKLFPLPGEDGYARIAPGYIIVTWSGGLAGIKETDWKPLKDRDVTIWAAPGEAGNRSAAKLAEKILPLCFASVVRDASTHITTADAETALELIMGAVTLAMPTPQAPAKFTPAVTVNDGAPEVPASARKTLESLGVTITSQGQALVNVDNIDRVLSGWKGWGADLVWFDEFHQRMFTQFNGPTREWSDNDTVILTKLLQREFGMQRASVDTVRQALTMYAHEHKRNEPRDWLDSLVWDGTRRLETFLRDYAHAEDNDYTRMAGLNWWRSLVARIYAPGIKVDTMLILKGEQGAGKSTLFELVGGPWYGIATADANDAKAFGETLQGKMIMELAELVNFTKTDAEAIKRLLSTPSDRYRAAYGYFAADHPRQGVLVGTTNKSEFLQDATGARRFWPIEAGTINQKSLAQDRPQLFAEAVGHWRAWLASDDPGGWKGHDNNLGWWKMPQEATKRAQESHRQRDEIESDIEAYIAEKPYGVILIDVWTECLGRAISQFDRKDQLRVGNALRALGWEPGKAERRDGKIQKIWRPINPPF